MAMNERLLDSTGLSEHEASRLLLDSAFAAQIEGRMDVWLQRYLRGPGANISLAEGLQYHHPFLVGPTMQDIRQFNRIAGPEEDIDYKEEEGVWEEKVSRMVEAIQQGWTAPPVIVVDFLRPGKLDIADGNHRQEALRRLGQNTYWTIVCATKSSSFQILSPNSGANAPNGGPRL